MQGVYAALADEVGAGSAKAIEQKFYRIRQEKLNSGNAVAATAEAVQEAPLVHVPDRKVVQEKGESLINAVEKLVRERDFYKEEYEKLLAERSRLKKLLGV